MFRYTPRTIPSQILIVGAGGTGSRLIPLLTQFIASITKEKNPRGWLDNPTIFIADDDVVEQKNLQRQNFVAADVGKHKAAVLAQRYGRAYGVNVLPILHKIDGTGAPFRGLVVPFDAARSMVIMCVDSAQARRDIIRTVNLHSRPATVGQGAFFIDAGNEDNFGQVRFFNQAIAIASTSVVPQDLPKLSPVVLDVPAIPMDFMHYATLEDNPGLGSCADLDQTLAINALMATMIMGIVQNYYYVKPMTYHQISISLDGGVSTSYNTASEFVRLANEFQVGATSARSKVACNNSQSVDVGLLAEKFKRETDKIMRAMTKTTVAETAVVAAPAEEATVKRARRKKAEPTMSEQLEVAVESHMAALLPDVRADEAAPDPSSRLTA